MSVLERFGIHPGSQSNRETAVYALACAYSLVEKQIFEYLKPYALTPAKFNALMIIKHIGKTQGLSQAQIGKRLIVTASNITRLLDKLQKEGYIERLSLKGDRRINLIKISQKGSSVLDRTWPGYYKKIISISSLLSAQELKGISHLLGKLCDGLGGSNG